MEASGVSRLNAVIHELEIVCDAASIPNEIHIPLDGLEIGDSVHISQVKLAEGVYVAIGGRDRERHLHEFVHEPPADRRPAIIGR